jgi:hypothetical protein
VAASTELSAPPVGLAPPEAPAAPPLEAPAAPLPDAPAAPLLDV